MIRRLFIWLLASAALVGCYSLEPGSRVAGPEEREAVRDVVSAWDASGLPSIGDCANQYAAFRTIKADDATLGNLCSTCAPGQCTPGHPAECPRGCASGCYVHDAKGPFWAIKRHPTAVYHISQPMRESVHHEALHWLSICGLGHVDYLHRDKRLWGSGGVLSKADAR